MFQWAPTLGGECYELTGTGWVRKLRVFQWAPTLGGECYKSGHWNVQYAGHVFQWAPTLGGECYYLHRLAGLEPPARCFNGHPPLGVNATLELPQVDPRVG